MKCKKWSLISSIFIILATGAGYVEAVRVAVGGYHEVAVHHPENEFPQASYRSQEVQNWQHGNGYGYTHNGVHYNYYYNGTYFNYYHDGNYYNYFYNGNYYNYYNNGLYYLYFFNGVYYNTCNQVPAGYPHCP